MTDFKILRRWDNSSNSNTFSKIGERAHLKIDGSYYILSEAWPMGTGYEIMLFAADKDEKVENFTDLWVTYESGFDKALATLESEGV